LNIDENEEEEEIKMQNEKQQRIKKAQISLRWNNVAMKDFNVLQEIMLESNQKLMLVEHRTSHELFEIKQIVWDQKEEDFVTRELHILSFLKGCEKVVKGCFPFKDGDEYYFASQYMSGGNLRTLLNHMGSLREEIIKLYIAQIIIVLHNIHKNSIVYCNLKPESIYFDENVFFNVEN